MSRGPTEKGPVLRPGAARPLDARGGRTLPEGKAKGKRDGKAKGKRDGKEKRDGYDKMGSFGLWFGDATNSAGRSW